MLRSIVEANCFLEILVRVVVLVGSAAKDAFILPIAVNLVVGVIGEEIAKHLHINISVYVKPCEYITVFQEIKFAYRDVGEFDAELLRTFRLSALPSQGCRRG